MSLKDQLMDDFKDAMKNKEKERLSTLKMIKSDIRNEEIEKGEDLSDDEIRSILSKQAKNREDSIEQYRDGDREDLAEKEERELEIIRDYLPEPLTPEELRNLVEETIDEVDASDMSDMGDVMDSIMPRVRGRAVGGQVNQLVREKLG